MASMSLQDAISRALDFFPHVDSLEREQQECISALINKKDVLRLLLTGFGKSLIYQLFPQVFKLGRGRSHCHVIVVSALKAITEEQVQELNESGIPTATIGDSLETDNRILNGEFKVLFRSAEMWLRKEWTEKLKTSHLRDNTKLIAHVFVVFNFILG